MVIDGSHLKQLKYTDTAALLKAIKLMAKPDHFFLCFVRASAVQIITAMQLSFHITAVIHASISNALATDFYWGTTSLLTAN